MSDYTWTSVYWMYSLMALFAVGAGFFLWRAIRSGAVSGDEAPKYRMLEEDELRSQAGFTPPSGAGGPGGAAQHPRLDEGRVRIS